MRIVTLNTWKNEGDYTRRLELMARGLADLEPDVICLQECFIGGGRDTASFLADTMGLCVYPRPARAKARRMDGRSIHSTSGLAMLSRARPISEDAIALPSDPRDGERIAQRADLAAGPGRLRILNLHLTHLADAAELRRRQLQAALQWAETDASGPIVVAGDLNARRGDPELAPLAEALPRRQGDTVRRGAAGPPVSAIDHCVLLPTDALAVTRSQVVLDASEDATCFVSDHAGVLLEIAITRRPHEDRDRRALS